LEPSNIGLWVFFYAYLGNLICENLGIVNCEKLGIFSFRLQGQITIGGWVPLTPGGSGHFVVGFYDIPGSRLYVSRGIGMSVIAARLGSRPEIAVFDL